MIEFPLDYKDFDGNDVVETWAFHLSMADIAQLEANGGFEGRYREALLKKDGAKVLELLQELMMASVGKRSEDRKRFRQDDKIRAEFRETGAFDALFTKLVLAEIPPAHFFNGVMPAGLSEKAARFKSMENTFGPEATAHLEEAIFPQGSPTQVKALDDFSDDELISMPNDQFTALIKQYKNDIPQRLLVIGMKRTVRS